jgi:hypothetical protein
LLIQSSIPQPHHGNDPYTPVISFLKQLRKARKHGGGGILGNREEEGIAAGSGSSEGFLNQENSSGGGNKPSVPILFPSGGGGGSSSGGSRESDRDRITIQLPANFPHQSQPQPSSPQDIQRINSGVSTILNGVKNFDLAGILRGAFIFPHGPSGNNVKTVANNVIDTIFGPLGGASGGDAPSPGSGSREG